MFCLFILTAWARAELELNEEFWKAVRIMIRDDGSEAGWIRGFSFNGINTLSVSSLSSADGIIPLGGHHDFTVFRHCFA